MFNWSAIYKAFHAESLFTAHCFHRWICSLLIISFFFFTYFFLYFYFCFFQRIRSGSSNLFWLVDFRGKKNFFCCSVACETDPACPINYHLLIFEFFVIELFCLLFPTKSTPINHPQIHRPLLVFNLTSTYEGIISMEKWIQRWWLPRWIDEQIISRNWPPN